MTVLIALLAALTAPVPQLQEAAPVLVSTEWLASRLGQPELVVLHVGNQASFTAGHIPGARLMTLASFAPERDGLSTEMPDAEALRATLEAAGVSTGSRIVVYGVAQQPTLAARLYVTLDHFGLGARTSMLDGSLSAWRAEGRALATEPTPVTPGTLVLGQRRDILADHLDFEPRLGGPDFAIVDARAVEFWTGEQRNQQRAARAGRIPDALNIPFSTLVDGAGLMLEPAALAALFRAAGVSEGQSVVTYCHVGQQASLLFVAARLAGHDVRLYDGSYEDWSRRPELPIRP